MQIIDYDFLTVKAGEQWYRDLPLKATRGAIFDKNGTAIVESKTVYTVYVRPNSVNDASKVAGVLSQYLEVDYDKLLEKIKTSKVSEITVKKGVAEDVGKRLISENLSGVYFSVDSARDYPYAEYLSQVIGYTNVDNQGQNGLEGYYDKFLKGTDGSANVQADNRGNEVDGQKFYLPPINGADLVTTLDVNIQGFAESAVNSAMLEWQSKSANILVMEAKTGAIVAMAQAPSYALDDIPRNDIALLNAYSKNSMIVDVYEPGSTFKIFTTAVAVENGVVGEADRFFCPGFRIVDGQRIKCWRSKGHSSQNLAEGVMNSCNCVFMDLALRLGTDKLYDGLKKLGFGSKTGVDFYSESSGILMKQSSVKTVDLARIGFGQAVAVTPLQLVTGVCQVVNGGVKVQPHFVDKIVDSSGSAVYEYQYQSERVLSEKTSEIMRELLENVVSSGSGKKASVAGYSIGGKTGTAQKYENGAIAQGKYVSSFVGFAPADNPKYVILMTVNEPTAGAYYGSIVAAPYVGQVFQKIFDYEMLAPSITENVAEKVVMPNLEGVDYAEAVNILQNLGLYYECDGDGKTVVSTLPIVGSTIEKGDVVLIRT